MKLQRLTFTYATVIIMAVLVIVACQNPGKRITGKWKAVSYIENGKKDTLDYFIEFTPEREVIISGNGNDLALREKMTYRLINDSIYFTKNDTSPRRNLRRKGADEI